MEKLKPIIENFESCVYFLKNSMHQFEQFEDRFKPIETESADGVNMDLITLKLFVDELFHLKQGTGEVIPQNLKTYDMMNNIANEKFLKTAFKMPLTILPLQNLGEIAMIMQKDKQAFVLLDMCIKCYKNLDS